MVPGIETTYWPVPSKRKPPEWAIDIDVADHTLGSLLTEVYAALNSDLKVLAAVGARTALDRATEFLGVAPALAFEKKLDALLTSGRIGLEERDILVVLVDAGSAAAHRGWKPKPSDLETMMDVIEAFLHRSFILGNGIEKLKAAVPAKPKRPAVASRTPTSPSKGN